MVCDTGHGKLQEFKLSRKFGTKGSKTGEFNWLTSMPKDSRD